MVHLAGGRDKHLPWDEFAQVAAERVDHLILFGEAVEVIRAALDDEAADYTLEVCRNLEQSVRTAAGVVSPGDVVLLSPGGTSFDDFKDFEELCQRFKDLVNAL